MVLISSTLQLFFPPTEDLSATLVTMCFFFLSKLHSFKHFLQPCLLIFSTVCLWKLTINISSMDSMLCCLEVLCFKEISS